MKRRSYGRDRGLSLRMLLTTSLLGLLYVVFAVVLFSVLKVGLAPMLVIIFALAFFQYYTSDKIALAAAGAKVVERDQAPELHAMIERLCVQANLPKPRVALAETPMPNAFAIGRSPRKATVCATTGILDLLSPPELEGVLAHELTHVQNRDVMVMTIASFFASIASFIVQMGFWFGGAFDDNDDNGPGFLVVILVSAVVYVISWLLLQALSRYREFAADRGSAIITGRPSALISALYKIEGGMQRVPKQDLRAASGEMAAFYIMPPTVKRSISTLFSTHPPLEARVARLQRLEAQLQRTA